jgi:hypothetical protein
MYAIMPAGKKSCGGCGEYQVLTTFSLIPVHRSSFRWARARRSSAMRRLM